MSRSWEEVKALLDDPYVDADTKEHLLAAYLTQEGYASPYGTGLGTQGGIHNEDDLPEDVRDYYDQYQLQPGDYQQGRLDEVYEDAQAESEERGYSAGLNDDAVEEGRTDIEDMRPPSEGSTVGVEKSDDIFEAARDALRIFQDFLPVNDKVPSDSLGRQGKLQFETDIVKRYEEQLGISFKNFVDDAARLRAAYGTLSELNTTTETELNNLYREWTGPAANASFQHYSEQITPNVTDLLEFLQTAPGMIDTAVSNIFAACKDKANDVISLYQSFGGTLGSATPDIADKVVTLANGDFDSQDQVLEVAAWVDSVTGSNLESTIRSDDCGLNDENKDYVIRECKKWIRESFNEDLHETLWVSFDQACTDALEAVNSHYEALNLYLKEYENKFAPAAPGTQNPGQQPGTQNPGTQNPGTQTPSVSTPPPSGTPGSSSPGSPGSPSMPSVSTPPSTTPSSIPSLGNLPTDPSNATTTPSATPLPSVNTPGSSTPGAIDPVTGLPITGGVPGSSGGLGGLPGAGGAPKEATIKDGNRTITVGQPDARGRSKVTVDDGQGEPREYEVDFTPDEPGETYEDGVLKAGPDGKVVIQDGDAAITLEQPPGQSGQMKMTVDDGTPTTYDFDFEAETDVPGSSGGGLPDVSTPSSLGGGPDGGGAGGVGGGGAGGGGVGGGGGGSFGGAETPGTSSPSGPGTMVGAQAPDGGERAGMAAAAAAGAGAGGAAAGGSAGGAPMGGMPMGGMGGGGQGGGDQSRQTKWRTTGSIFDDQDPASNFSGVVGRDPAENPKAPKR
ncbi:WXG100 family type VII secretion target [Actinophytocola glycyrrhizae]|uniref:WXG100 family type VII secretion target n=1 Tax=Actinophytocola glycyrrhizae TaxID=2044873 RepID=A0ABV9RVG2_9PSEU